MQEPEPSTLADLLGTDDGSAIEFEPGRMTREQAEPAVISQAAARHATRDEVDDPDDVRVAAQVLRDRDGSDGDD